jgi:hypothetical protein
MRMYTTDPMNRIRDDLDGTQYRDDLFAAGTAANLWVPKTHPSLWPGVRLPT